MNKKLAAFFLRLFRYLFFGLLLTIGGEFLNQVIVHHSLTAYFSTLIMYVVLLIVGYLLQAVISVIIRNKTALEIFSYIFFGIAGLIIEWFFIGNAPWEHTQALQLGMFTWWACLWVMPHLFMEKAPAYKALKKSFWRFFIIFTLVYLVASVTIPVIGLGLGILIYSYGTVILNYFFVRYLMITWRESRAN